MLYKQNAPTNQLSFRPGLLLRLSASLEYLVVRTSHNATTFYVNRMQLMESRSYIYIFYFTHLFCFWGSCEFADKGHSSWLSHQEWSAGSWSEVSPSQENFLWGDQCVIHRFVNESYILLSLKETWLTCDPVWCDSISFDTCMAHWSHQNSWWNLERKWVAKRHKKVLQKWGRTDRATLDSICMDPHRKNQLKGILLTEVRRR